jgi:uncharacterized protein with ParB-like and HNH nuclease domain
MSGFQTPITIYQAIDRINVNKYLLPAFQREFVWTADQIEKLFDSLMRGYPISSMLFWKVEGSTKANFKFYQFLKKYIERYGTHNEIISTNALNDFHAILDGQQRLTALYIGLCGSYAYHMYNRSWVNTERSFPTRHLYLNISKEFTDEESDKKYNFKFLDKFTTNEHDIFADKNNEKWFKVGTILRLYKNDEIDDFQEKYSISREEKKRLNKLERIITTESYINFYEEDGQNPDKAVNIFVRINSGGTFLSFSDILFSIAVSSWKKKDARTEINSLVDLIRSKGYNIDKNYILKAFLYLYHTDVRFKITSFNNNFIESIEENWDMIRNAVISLFDLFITYGLTDYTLTSYNATLPVLYYLYHKNIYIDFSTKAQYKQDRAIIRNWLLVILVRQIFGSEADTVLAQSRNAFTDSIGQIKITNFSLFPAEGLNREIKKLGDVGDDFIEGLLLTQKDNKYCFSILALLYPHMDYRNNNFHKDHLHPVSQYGDLRQEDKEEYGWQVYNSILNLQMLNSNENMAKQDLDLKKWVQSEIKNYDYKKFMDEHIIPENIELAFFS